MYKIYVKGRDFYNLKGVPVAGVTSLFVQGEIGIPLEFVFNTNSEHDGLETASFKAWYKRRDGQGLDVDLPSPTTNADGTFSVTWAPDEHVTCLNGALAFCIAAYKGTTQIWKTKAIAVTVSKTVEPEIIDPNEKHLTYDTILNEFETWVASKMGVANGIATLGADGKVPKSQLDLGALDNFEIGFYYNGNFYSDSSHTIAMVPKEEAIYINKGTNPASLYVYDGTKYEKVSDSSSIYTKEQVDALLNGKVNTEEGKGLSTEDFTTSLKGKLADLPTNTSLEERLTGIEGDVSDLDADKYEKPSAGIPKTDLASDVQTSLGKADTALQQHQDITGKQDIIEDLQTIREGAALGATSIQEHQSLSAYRTSSEQDEIDATKISGVKKNGTVITPVDGVVNITVPVSASDVSALADSTKYGSSLEVSVDSSTYVCTFKLKDQSGNLLGTEQTIDLPLETMVVGGSYDKINKKIKLTLKNGQTVGFPVEDIVEGLVSASDLNAILGYYYTKTESDGRYQQKALVTTLENADDTHYPSARLVGELRGDIDNKADAEHRHDISDVTGLNTVLGSIDATKISGVRKNGTVITPVDGVVNITVPVSASDVSALADSTKYGSSLEVSVDSSTYVCTFKLKDQSGNLLGTEQTINLPLKTGVVYGIHVNEGEAVSADMITYLRDAVGMIPAKMNFASGVFDYGSWQDAFFMPKPCMLKYDGTVDYYLSKKNYALKEDGSASDVSDEAYEGNAMMEWGANGTIWYKLVPDDGDSSSYSIYIADHQEDEDYVCWSFINNEGNAVNRFYTPIYNGWVDSAGRMRSLSGKTLVNDITGTAEITACQNNNPSGKNMWYTEVFCDNQLITYLLMLMGKSNNSQSVYGKGRCNGGSSISSCLATGSMDSRGMFWGTDSTGSGVKVFGMENFWGNCWRRYAGHSKVNSEQRVKMTWTKKDGSTANGYNTNGSGFLAIAGATPTGSFGGYIKTMKATTQGIVPVDTSGSDSTYYADGLLSVNSATTYALRGGDCGADLRAGLFSCSLANAVSDAGWYIGACLSCKPLS